MAKVRFAFGGVNNVLDPLELGAISDPRSPRLTELVSGVNVDLSDRSAVRRREGHAKVYTGTPHSLWNNAAETEAFTVEAGILKRVNADYTTTAITALSNNNRLAFCEVNDSIACTNGTDFLVVFGGQVSPAQPTAKIGRIPTRPGFYLAFFDGRLYIATTWGLYHTDLYDIDYMDEANCRIPLGGRVGMVAAVDDGLWAGTQGKIVFLAGADALDFAYREAADYGVVPGAFGTCNADALGIAGVSGKAVVFASHQGICIGTNGGRLLNLSRTKFSYRPGASGAVVLREAHGLVHIIAAMQDPNTAFNKDSVTIPLDS